MLVKCREIGKQPLGLSVTITDTCTKYLSLLTSRNHTVGTI